jgi:chromosomal replication initiation ATPase DnaA
MNTYKQKQLNEVLTKTCKETGVYKKELLAKERGTSYTANIRHEVWRVLNKDYKWTKEEIGKAFNRDHSTVVRGVNKLTIN